jgi:trehalose 6-phosphate synthase
MDSVNDLLVLSNRGPVSFARDPGGQVRAKRGGGGLVVTLGPGAQHHEALWLSAATSDDELEGFAGSASAAGYRIRPVKVAPSDYSAYYDVAANQTLWFCVHGLWDLPRRPRFDRHWWGAWKSFQSVNGAFATEAANAAAEGATVLVQDYQLSLVPAMLSRMRPDLRVVSFVHTPWCSPQELSVLPDVVSREVLSGLAGAKACGFHSSRWARAFEACCDEYLGLKPHTFVSPAAADSDDILAVAGSPACQAETDKLEAEIGERKLIVRVDRIELSKNVLRGFWAYDELLERRSDLRGKVVFAAKVYPSRLGLAEYQAYGQEVQALASHINAKWEQPGWTPIALDPDDNFPKAVAALSLADVLLVNPVRDGLNLVAKEGPLVNRRNGSVVLSHQAGVWDELAGAAIGVNPFDISGTAEGIARALDLTPAERAKRAKKLRSLAGATSPLQWFDAQLARADEAG